jgi:transposase-like protein
MTLADEEQAGRILSQDARGRVLVTPERRESLLEEYDRSGMSGVRIAKYVGIKYTTLAYWLKRRRSLREREKLRPEAGKEPARSNGTWIEAVVEKNGSPARAPVGALRIYFAAGAYCQISTTAEAALAAELLGRLGTKR